MCDVVWVCCQCLLRLPVQNVYAIDKSNIVQLTRRVVCENRLANKITIVQGSAADINLPVDEVDVIISTPFV